jgi:DDE family transposase
MPKPSPIVRYRIRNWRAYNRALINRGRLTVWFDEQTIAGWRHTAPATGPGAPRRYADLAIECALVFKSVYPLSLRAAQGFLSSVGEVMKLALSIPDYSTVSRRQGVLQVPVFALPQSSPRHAVSDATGLRVYGAGEWQVRTHRVSRRRTWRKLHLGIDETTKAIVAVELTGRRVHDSQPLPKGRPWRSTTSALCTVRDAASRRMTLKPSSGIASPPPKGVPWGSTTSASGTTMEKAFRRTMYKPTNGSLWLPQPSPKNKRVMRQQRLAIA